MALTALALAGYGHRLLHGGTRFSNLQQLSRATLMYVRDNDQTFPAAYSACQEGGRQSHLVSWYARLSPYLKTHVAPDQGWAFVDWWGNTASPADAGLDESPWHCPLDAHGGGPSYGVNSLEALLKAHFRVVVDWRDDSLRHQTHFHCEVRGPRPVEW